VGEDPGSICAASASQTGSTEGQTEALSGWQEGHPRGGEKTVGAKASGSREGRIRQEEGRCQEGSAGKSDEEECAPRESGAEEGNCEEGGPSSRAGCGRACGLVAVPEGRLSANAGRKWIVSKRWKSSITETRRCDRAAVVGCSRTLSMRPRQQRNSRGKRGTCISGWPGLWCSHIRRLERSRSCDLRSCAEARHSVTDNTR